MQLQPCAFVLHCEIIQVDDGHLFINTVSEVINDERFYDDAIHVRGIASHKWLQSLPLSLTYLFFLSLSLSLSLVSSRSGLDYYYNSIAIPPAATDRC